MEDHLNRRREVRGYSTVPSAFIMVLFLQTVFTLTLHGQEDSRVPHVIVLGVAQDGGYPHIGCEKTCCVNAHRFDSLSKFVVSLALVDPANKKWWLFEATPDMEEQLHLFRELTSGLYSYLPQGIFITHAHMGHYTGLMELGREAMGASNVPVHVLPRMSEYLKNNGPWSQLVELKNIKLIEEHFEESVKVSDSISITPFKVPHRDEYSETVGFKIETIGKNYLFIPDIDKWEKWEKGIVEEVSLVDVAFVDATFWSITELPFRNIKTIPHPLVSETMAILKDANKEAKRKVTFIHFNHSNKLMWDEDTRRIILEKGFSVAEQGKSY
jgi:pyrroloquinoline quinone biosynthesis protein B